MQTQKFSEQELRKIIQQLEDLDYQYKIGLIDLNIGLDAINRKMSKYIIFKN